MWLITLALAIAGVRALDNGLALTPQMGWNTWNTFVCDVSEELLLSTAQSLVDLGLRDLGYEYVVLDDCWSLKQRNETGHLVADPERFPNGMNHVADQIHDLGLKYGMYGSAGVMTCARYPGQLYNEEIDANTFASWDIDYLKYDNCYCEGLEGDPRTSFERFNKMSVALNNTGRPILYSMCNWGIDGPWHFAQTIANSWRMSGDIEDYFDKEDPRCPCEAEGSQLDCKFAGNHCSMMKILDFVAPYSHNGRPGRWNDLDMLEVGRGGMTYEEYVTHFSMWAMVKSPLILGNDIREMTPETYSIVANPAVIAISQDPEGRPAERRYKRKTATGNVQLWVAELSDDSYAVAIINHSPRSRSISVTFEDIFDLNFTAAAFEWEIRDLWAGPNMTIPEPGSIPKDASQSTYGDVLQSERALGVNIGRFSKVLTASVKSHSTRLFRLRKPTQLAESALHEQPVWKSWLNNMFY